MMDEELLETFRKILTQIASETVRLIPKIFIALVVVLLTVAVIKILNFAIRKIFKVVRLDEAFEKLSRISLPFSLSKAIVWIADLGIALISFYSLVNLFLGAQYTHLFAEAVYYGARLLSIVALTIVIFALFNSVIEKMKVETRLKGYMFFILLFLVTAMLIDVTALSDPLKSSLTMGLSIGVGISVGVFAVWFFFHEYLDKWLKRVEQQET